MARVKVLEEYSEEIEELREEHRPDDIEALFVGESPPPQGKGGIRFFYSLEAPNGLREFMRDLRRTAVPLRGFQQRPEVS